MPFLCVCFLWAFREWSQKCYCSTNLELLFLSNKLSLAPGSFCSSLYVSDIYKQNILLTPRSLPTLAYNGIKWNYWEIFALMSSYCQSVDRHIFLRKLKKKKKYNNSCIYCFTLIFIKTEFLFTMKHYRCPFLIKRKYGT